MSSSPIFLLDETPRGFMQPVDHRLPAAEANLDLDAALLGHAERAGGSEEPLEFLRFWESPEYCVVLGHSSRETLDVRLEAYQRAGVPMLRRISGGGTVLLGPGCLNFSLVLSLTSRPALHVVRDSMRIILAAVARGLALQSVRSAGMSDLTWQGRKFSGNAQRRGRHALLHHGTILYNFDIARVSEFLHEPRRQPTYRMQRSHEQFLCNIPLDPQRIRQGLAWAFHAVRKNCR